MAGEEDSELRDLVAQSLEAKGVLGKIRAQLRASVFLAMEEQGSKERYHSLENERLDVFMKTKEGQLTVGLVREFLEFFELDFTCSVFDPESNVLNSYVGREKLAAQVGLVPSSDGPVLLEVLRQSREQACPPSMPLAQLPPLLAGSPLPLVPAVSSSSSTAVATPLTQPPSFSTAANLSRDVPLELIRVPAAGSASTSGHQPVGAEGSTRPTGAGLPDASDSNFQPLDPKFFTPSFASAGKEGDSLASSSLNVDHLTGFGADAESSQCEKNSQKKRQKDSTVPTEQNKSSGPQRPPAKSKNGGEHGNSSGSDDDSLSGLLSAKYETTDHSLSQTSTAGEFDFAEPVQ